MSQAPNLTRAQASERSATVTVSSYEITIDLTDGTGGPGEKTFRTDTVVTFDAEPGASTFIDFVGDGIAQATLNGRDLDVGSWTNTGGLPLDDLAATNELTVSAVGIYTNTGEGLHRFVDPVDGAVYLYSQFETADAKRLFACFDQPDLKARFTVTVTAPADWQVVSNGATTSTEPGPSGAVVHRFATTEPMSTYVTALIAGPYHVIRDHHDGIDLGIFCRSSLARAPGRGPAVHRDQAGFRLLPRCVRCPVPVRQVRPALRAGVQRRRDGERRCGDVPRGVRLPLPGDPGPLRAPLRDDPARDGPHVVRRPGHHALVGRPVAERVVRHLGLGGRAGVGHRVHLGAGRRSRTRRSPGPTSRTSCRRPIRSRPTWWIWRRSRSTSTASPTPRAPACSSNWPRTWGSTSS